jgi:hypothetical protein
MTGGMIKRIGVVLSGMILLPLGCGSRELDRSVHSKYGTFRFSDRDSSIVRDLIAVCDTSLPAIVAELDLRIVDPVVLEIQPDQETYDRRILNPDMKGSPAISGNGKIQLVSPLAKINMEGLSRDDRLMLLVHEYIHVLIDGLEKEPPIFIDEGIASFYSSRGFYLTSARRYVKPIGFIPTIEQLRNHYRQIPAPDLFSFLFVEFIAQTKGRKALSGLLRSPEWLDREEVNSGWKDFVGKNF